MKLKIAVIPGDGIGPDIVSEGLKVLGEVAMAFGHRLDFSFYLAGGAALDAMNIPLPESTVLGCKDSDAVLLGAVGGPAWDHLSGELRPEQALFRVKRCFRTFLQLAPCNIISTTIFSVSSKRRTH